MSQYVKYDCKALTNEETLLAALQEMGWKPEQIERHDTPVHLYGYEGRERKEKANIVIRKHNVSSAANDIGFVKLADGTFQPIVSEYDTTAIGPHKRSGDRDQGFVPTLERSYTRITGEASIKTVLETTIPRMRQQGIIPRTAMPSVVRVGSKVQITLSY